jgi:hypothetical protein
MTNHHRRVTPETDPDRFTEEAKALFYQGRCCQTIGNSRGRIEYCGDPSKSGASFGYCPEHHDQLLWDFYADGTPRQ